MNEIEIRKAKVTSFGHMEVEYKETVRSDENDTDSFSNEVVKKCNYDPHPDLFDAFDGLSVYLAELCELMPDIDLSEEAETELLKKYKVTGFVIGGHDEHEGVTIIGRKKLAHNRVLNLVTPFTKWEDEHNGYGRAWEMKIQVEKCKDEVIAYLEGKRKPDAQLELEFEDHNHTDIL